MKTRITLSRPKFPMLLLALLTIIGLACRKDYATTFMEPSDPKLEYLKSWYNQNKGSIEDAEFAKLAPIWKEVYMNEKTKDIVYEIRLENPEHLMISGTKRSLSNINDEVYRHSDIKLLIFQSRINGKIKTAAFSTTENHTSVNSDDVHYRDVNGFTGNVYFYTLEGKFSNGWQYRDGIVSNSVKPLSQKEYLDQQQKSTVKPSSRNGGSIATMTESYECASGFVDKYKYACITVEGHMSCEYVYAGSEYVTICRWVQKDSVAPIDDDPYGGWFDGILLYDCHDELNGTAYVNQSCNTCMGGNTGVDACLSDITDDIKNDCLKNVWDSIKNDVDSKITSILTNTFAKNDKVNFKIKDANITGGAPAQTQVVSNYTKNGVHHFDIKVIINKNVLPNSSKEYIATTIVHEIMHAYFNYNKVFYEQQFAQHKTMAESYINELREAIQNIYPSISTKHANALILNGFGDIFKNDLPYWNTLLDEYNLDNQEIIDIRDAYKSSDSTVGTRCSN